VLLSLFKQRLFAYTAVTKERPATKYFHQLHLANLRYKYIFGAFEFHYNIFKGEFSV
jgi:hypothetical protein